MAGDYSPGQRRAERLQPGDKVSEHMLRLYDQYSGGQAAAARPQDPPGLPAPSLRRGNTVRGFRPLAAGETPAPPQGSPSVEGRGREER